MMTGRETVYKLWFQYLRKYLISASFKRETSTDLWLLYVSSSCVFRSGVSASGRGGGDSLLAQYGPDLP